ncbi:MAG: patatin-like phospholipase family protein [Candidatus Dormibacteraceae bacterium]
MKARISIHRRMLRRRSSTAWVLGGGAARGAAQVGSIFALMEAGLAAPSAIIGSSVGALDGAVMAAYPDLDGAHMLRRLWLSRPARDVFHLHPLGAIMSQLSGKLGPLSADPLRKLIEKFESDTGSTTFEDLSIPLLVVATDLDEGRRVVFHTGPLEPALLASTSIPGLFPPVRIGDHDYSDGGIVDNVPIAIAVREGFHRILAIGLMGGAQMHDRPSSWNEVIARTLQLSLHQRLLSDFERLRTQARIVIICPITPAEAAWDMSPEHVSSLIKRSHEATARLLVQTGRALFQRSAIHYLDLEGDQKVAAKTVWLADAL